MQGDLPPILPSAGQPLAQRIDPGQKGTLIFTSVEGGECRVDYSPKTRWTSLKAVFTRTVEVSFSRLIGGEERRVSVLVPKAQAKDVAKKLEAEAAHGRVEGGPFTKCWHSIEALWKRRFGGGTEQAAPEYPTLVGVAHGLPHPYGFGAEVAATWHIGPMVSPQLPPILPRRAEPPYVLKPILALKLNFGRLIGKEDLSAASSEMDSGVELKCKANGLTLQFPKFSGVAVARLRALGYPVTDQTGWTTRAQLKLPWKNPPGVTGPDAKTLFTLLGLAGPDIAGEFQKNLRDLLRSSIFPLDVTQYLDAIPPDEPGDHGLQHAAATAGVTLPPGYAAPPPVFVAPPIPYGAAAAIHPLLPLLPREADAQGVPLLKPILALKMNFGRFIGMALPPDSTADIPGVQLDFKQTSLTLTFPIYPGNVDRLRAQGYVVTVAPESSTAKITLPWKNPHGVTGPDAKTLFAQLGLEEPTVAWEFQRNLRDSVLTKTGINLTQYMDAIPLEVPGGLGPQHAAATTAVVTPPPVYVAPPPAFLAPPPPFEAPPFGVAAASHPLPPILPRLGPPTNALKPILAMKLNFGRLIGMPGLSETSADIPGVQFEFKPTGLTAKFPAISEDAVAKLLSLGYEVAVGGEPPTAQFTVPWTNPPGAGQPDVMTLFAQLGLRGEGIEKPFLFSLKASVQSKPPYLDLRNFLPAVRDLYAAHVQTQGPPSPPPYAPAEAVTAPVQANVPSLVQAVHAFEASQDPTELMKLMVRTPFPSKLSAQEFQELAMFFDKCQEKAEGVSRENGNYTTEFRRLYQFVTAKVFNHRPETLGLVASISRWCKHMVAMDAANKEWLESHPSALASFEVDPSDLRELHKDDVDVPEQFEDLDSGILHVLKDQFGNPVETDGYRAHHLKQIDIESDYKDPKAVAVRATSSIVPPAIALHVVQKVDDNAIGVKYLPSGVDGIPPATRITRGQALYRFFTTGVGRVEMGADVFHARAITPLGKSAEGKTQCRDVLVSDQVHPDFEISGPPDPSAEGLFYSLAEPTDKPVRGAPLPEGFQVPSEEEMAAMTEAQRTELDDKLLKHLIYHLYPDGIRPAKNDLSLEIIDMAKAREVLEGLIESSEDPGQIPEILNKQYVQTPDGHLVSLRVMFTTYLHQVQNEFKILEKIGKPYVYTLHPPAIFAFGGDEDHEDDRLAGATIMNRLQCLAFKYVGSDQFEHLSAFIPNCYSDPTLADLYEKALPGKTVMSMETAWESGDSSWSAVAPEGTVLVIHTNGDEFGFNPKSEGAEISDDQGGPTILSAASLDAAVSVVGSTCIAFDPTNAEQVARTHVASASKKAPEDVRAQFSTVLRLSKRDPEPNKTRFVFGGDDGKRYVADMSPDGKMLVIAPWIPGFGAPGVGYRSTEGDNTIVVRLDENGRIVAESRGGEQAPRVEDAKALLKLAAEVAWKELHPPKPPELELTQAGLISLAAAALPPGTVDTKAVASYDPNIVVVGEGPAARSYMVWIRTLGNGQMAVNIQEEGSYRDSRMDGKIGLNIDSDGRVDSVYIDGVLVGPPAIFTDPSIVTPAHQVLIKSVCTGIMKQKSSFSTGRDWDGRPAVAVSSVLRAPLEVPEYQLPQIGKVLHTTFAPGAPRLFEVKLRGDDLKNLAGVDAGGLSRTYLGLLSHGFAQGANIACFARSKDDRSARSDKFSAKMNEEAYKTMGELFSICWDSVSELPGQGNHWDRTLMTGDYFCQGLFATAFHLTYAQTQGPLTPELQRSLREYIVTNTDAHFEGDLVHALLDFRTGADVAQCLRGDPNAELYSSDDPGQKGKISEEIELLAVSLKNPANLSQAEITRMQQRLKSLRETKALSERVESICRVVHSHEPFWTGGEHNAEVAEALKTPPEDRDDTQKDMVAALKTPPADRTAEQKAIVKGLADFKYIDDGWESNKVVIAARQKLSGDRSENEKAILAALGKKPEDRTDEELAILVALPGDKFREETWEWSKDVIKALKNQPADRTPEQIAIVAALKKSPKDRTDQELSILVPQPGDKLMTEAWELNQKVIAALKKPPGERTEDEAAILAALPQEWDRAQGDPEYMDTQWAVVGLSKDTLQGVQYIASGMARGVKTSVASREQAWDEVRRTGLKAYAEKVQGKMSREQVVMNFKMDHPHPDADTRRRYEWIKTWLESEASDDEVREFVEWITGAPGVPKKGLLFACEEGNKGPIPFVHTCACQMVISPPRNVHESKRALYNTREGFLDFIKEGMKIKTLTAA